MTKTLAALALATLTLTACAGHPERRASIAPGGVGDVDAMRADLRTCLDETSPLDLIPDLGITFERHLKKCMSQRSWILGWDTKAKFYSFTQAAGVVTKATWATGE